jgi:hypothetical protein
VWALVLEDAVIDVRVLSELQHGFGVAAFRLDDQLHTIEHNRLSEQNRVGLTLNRFSILFPFYLPIPLPYPFRIYPLALCLLPAPLVSLSPSYSL